MNTQSFIHCQETKNLNFYGVNMNQRLRNFGCSESEMALSYYESKVYGHCIVDGAHLDSIDVSFKNLFEEIKVAYKTDKPKSAVAVLANTYFQNNPVLLSDNFYSANKLIRKQYGNPKEIVELENGDAVYLWETDSYMIILAKFIEDGNLQVIYSIDKNFK
jgi:hypothetical protein